MKNKAQKRKIPSKNGGILFSIILGTCSTVIILFILLALFCCIALNAKNPHVYLTPLSFFAIYTSAFFGGFIATKKNSGRDALLCGSLTGIASSALLCLIFLVVGIIFKTQSTPLSWLFRALGILFSLLGALPAAKTKKSPKKARRRKK